MELAGHKCVGFCEYDEFATASYTSMHLITDEQRKYLSTLPLNKRQKEILKEEYRNGEWYAKDIRSVNAGNVPRCDCYCFGAPCQDFSVAGLRAGMGGDRSSLVREVFRIVREVPERDRPEWLIYENVTGMFSSNEGRDYLGILMEMDELGYDIEWQVFNSKDYVPQNRERVYTIGHFRRFGERKILPIQASSGKNPIPIKQVGTMISHRNNPNDYRVYDPSMCGAAVLTEVQPYTMKFIDLTKGNGVLTEEAIAIIARQDAGVTKRGGERSGCCVIFQPKESR
jgi:DNA (cytosine-5)-methyltransferase 1